MYYKIQSALLGMVALALNVNAQSAVQVNLFSDSNCHDYIEQFVVTDTNINYNYQYNGAHSFGIAGCATPVPGTCQVFNSGGGESSVDSDYGAEGKCVAYDGNTDSKWKIYLTWFDEGNNGE